ncbi:MOSC domain-containing protein [Ktedonosporobacter rubrisoli]|uniref:MOSC domain-containing protein n=1 Tax=Ktedonosporobacter rubrisoli TaxID=2509675 RepID=UPI0013EE867F|nr:MOSC domain-containing protein [Ktedonosporobacter rubrisoli]
MSTHSSQGIVFAVSRKVEPGVPKLVVDAIQLVTDWGVEGDYHAGRLVRHRYLARKDPTRPNIRQVLLVDTGIYAELAQKDIRLDPGMFAENITLEGISVMDLAVGTRLRLGEAVVEISEIRHPCHQLNEMDKRLLKAVIEKEQGQTRFKAGVFARILQGGWLRPGDRAIVLSPSEPAIFA